MVLGRFFALVCVLIVYAPFSSATDSSLSQTPNTACAAGPSGSDDNNVKCTVAASDVESEDDVVTLMQASMSVVGKHKRASKKAATIEEIISLLASRVEEETRTTRLKFHRLGYPRDELSAMEERVKAKVSTMSFAELQAATWSSTGIDDTRPECVAAKLSASAYGFGAHGEMMAGDAAKDDLKAAGYVFVRGFNKTEGTDHDYLGWWKKGDDCFFNFMGSDDKSELGASGSNADSTAIDKWNLTGVHRGLTVELEGLVNKIDFAAVKGQCTGGLTVVGHSMGGGLAQLFTAALNQPADYFGADLHVDNLYTFGAVPVSDVRLSNSDAADGCFPGKQFFNARTATDGTIEVDVLAGLANVANEPVKSNKALLFGPQREQSYECGNKFPVADFRGAGWDLHLIATYEYNLGCISFFEYWAYVSALMAAQR